MTEIAHLTVVGNPSEAEALCLMLRAEGIECMHRPTNFAAGATDGLASLAGPTEILVTANELERARALLAPASQEEIGETATGGPSAFGAWPR